MVRILLLEFTCLLYEAFAVSQSQSYLTTDGQSACLSWCQTTIRARDQFVFLLEIFFRQLRVCYFVAPSLMRGRVCNLLLLLVLASAVPQDSRPYLIVPILENPPTWNRNRVAQIYLLALGSLSATSYDYGGGILSRLHTGMRSHILFISTQYSLEYNAACKRNNHYMNP
jgi:hypothetical protein